MATLSIERLKPTFIENQNSVEKPPFKEVAINHKIKRNRKKQTREKGLLPLIFFNINILILLGEVAVTISPLFRSDQADLNLIRYFGFLLSV